MTAYVRVVVGTAEEVLDAVYPRGVVVCCRDAGKTLMSPAYKEVYPMLEGREVLAGLKVAARPEDE